MATPLFNQAMSESGVDAPHFSDHVQAVTLVADVEQTVNVPPGYNIVSFATTGNFFAKNDATAVVPSGPITDGSAPDVNPSIRYIGQEGREPTVSVIHLIAAVPCTVILSFYNV